MKDLNVTHKHDKRAVSAAGNKVDFEKLQILILPKQLTLAYQTYGTNKRIFQELSNNVSQMPKSLVSKSIKNTG